LALFGLLLENRRYYGRQFVGLSQNENDAVITYLLGPDLERIVSATCELLMISGTYDKLMTNLGETYDSL